MRKLKNKAQQHGKDTRADAADRPIMQRAHPAGYCRPCVAISDIMDCQHLGRVLVEEQIAARKARMGSSGTWDRIQIGTWAALGISMKTSRPSVSADRAVLRASAIVICQFKPRNASIEKGPAATDAFETIKRRKQPLPKAYKSSTLEAQPILTITFYFRPKVRLEKMVEKSARSFCGLGVAQTTSNSQRPLSAISKATRPSLSV